MNEHLTRAQLEEAAAAIRARVSVVPKIALILGSGLGQLADNIDDAVSIPYADIPHWPVTTVAGHSGHLIVGRLEHKDVLVMQGRAHFYEGHPIEQIAVPARVMSLLGINIILVTNAAGGMNAAYTPGDLMLIKDHINFPGLAGHNPLRGANDDRFGPRFPDMTEPYDGELRALAHKIAGEAGFSLQEGTYAFVSGPNYESPAELRLLQTVGADAVGMSTVPTVLVARHAGIRILGISTITNLALPDPPPGQITSHEEVLATGKLVIPRLTAIIRGVVRHLPA